MLRTVQAAQFTECVLLKLFDSFFRSSRRGNGTHKIILTLNCFSHACHNLDYTAG